MNAIWSTVLAASAGPPDSWGKWVFSATLGLLLIWLVLMPRRLIGQQHEVPPWWRNVRVWAIVVATVQMCVYVYYG